MLCREGWIDTRHLPPKLLGRGLTPPGEEGVVPDGPARRALINVLREAGGNQSEAAAMLGLHRNTLRKKIRELGIE